MKIDYRTYLVFPYTETFLRKNYTQDILDRFGKQLAMLFQNGIKLADDSLSQIEEQLSLFNNFETWEDLEQCLAICGVNKLPTKIGYKIVDSVLVSVIKETSWSVNNFVDVKKFGQLYHDSIEKTLKVIEALIHSADLEVSKVVGKCFSSNLAELVDECLDMIESDSENYGTLLINYQKIYQQVGDVHKKINFVLQKTADKSTIPVIGNVNDEVYGSSGYYNPNTGEMRCACGSALHELKTLCSEATSESLYFKMLVIAKEAIKQGENNSLLLAFKKGDKTKIEEVRKVLTEICFDGIVTLLCLKHKMNLIKDDLKNEERAKKVMSEIEDVCKFAGYKMRKTA